VKTAASPKFPPGSVKFVPILLHARPSREGLWCSVLVGLRRGCFIWPRVRGAILYCAGRYFLDLMLTLLTREKTLAKEVTPDAWASWMLVNRPPFLGVLTFSSSPPPNDSTQ
jgi:hypothetical protein